MRSTSLFLLLLLASDALAGAADYPPPPKVGKRRARAAAPAACAAVDASTKFLWKMEANPPTDEQGDWVFTTGGTAGSIDVVAGKYGNGLHFYSNGWVKDSAQTSGDAALFDDADWTIDGWLYLHAYPSNTNNAWILSLSGPNDDSGDNTIAGAALLQSGRLATFWEYGAGTNVATNQTSGNAIPLTTWTHFAVVKSGLNVLFYVGGTLQQTVAAAAHASGGANGVWTISGWPGGTYTHNWVMDDLQVSTVARDATWIATKAACSE